MIQISGVPFQSTQAWPVGSIERTIVDRMMNSSSSFEYRSMNEQQFELELRRSIIRSARLLNQSNAAFEVFERSRSNPVFWYTTRYGGFQLRPGVRPSIAIDDIYRNGHLYGFECATAMIIVYYYAVLQVIGAAKFDQLFPDLYLYSWNFDPDLALNTGFTNQFIPGDVVYFNNPQFNPQTPEWRGVNAVVLEDGTYYGHGMGIMRAEQMIASLNESRAPWSTQPAYLTNMVTRPGFTYLANVSLQRHSRPEKLKYMVVEHNESSISFDRYVYYLNNSHLFEESP
ncbi:protein-glutamine gamma-glutamyltransferase [Alkalihalophilus lindianensis]|uniref:Protein-glutamine gamma-glutamyltransferase n=1 Tax=Alkalihalophilus lindianensis TaxID=1630542 RepID=A0ABU3XFF4_9BACI|nr:protein-glutamine gamma-glutamyltransferase [Alkalihalophilus lindianensis]MDV2686342.1 protein-glutamine gamma-glutamyltransferase [Alkalihalophilus lindianensis]